MHLLAKKSGGNQRELRTIIFPENPTFDRNEWYIITDEQAEFVKQADYFVDVTETPDGIQITEIPHEPIPVPVHGPTAQDDTDAMLVDHELRLTMLELGLNEGV